MNHSKELVDRLVEETGCDEVLATMLLKFTGGDIEGAKRIIEAVPKDIFAVKGKFITQVTGYYGAFFFCYDGKEGNIKRLISVISDDKDVAKFDLALPWQRFEEILYDYARNKKVDALKIEQFKRLFTDSEFISKLANVFKPGAKVKKDVFENLLLDELYNIFADTNIAVKFEIEMTDAFALNKSLKEADYILEEEKKEERSIDEEVEKSKKANQSLIVLKVSPELSPVRGVEIKNLEFGDEIQVRITDEREIADYLAELLGGKVDSIRVPIYTKIVEVKELEGGNVGVLTQFGPGIMGMFKVPEDVKVVTREVAEEEPEVKEVRNKKELSPLLILAGIFVIIVIFIVLIMMS